MASSVCGGCLCGRVRYEISAPLQRAGYCHCTRCQRRSGTGASANARIARGALHVTRGGDAVRDWIPEHGFVKSFCSVCGSALWSYDPADPEVRAIRLGTIDGDPGVRPEYRQWLDSAAVWETIPDDGLERHPESAFRLDGES